MESMIDIADRIDAVFFQDIALEKISERAEARNRDALAAQVVWFLDLRPDQQFALHTGHRVRHGDEIGAAQVGAHHRRQRARRAENAIADDRLGRLS